MWLFWNTSFGEGFCWINASKNMPFCSKSIKIILVWIYDGYLQIINVSLWKVTTAKMGKKLMECVLLGEKILWQRF